MTEIEKLEVEIKTLQDKLVILKQVEKYKSKKLWYIMRDKLGFSIDMCDEIVEAVERWLPKEDPRPSYDTMQWDKCVRMMREKLWEQSE